MKGKARSCYFIYKFERISEPLNKEAYAISIGGL
jgi:hypothetical protein